MRWSLLLAPTALLLVVLATSFLGSEYAATRDRAFPPPFLGLDHLLAAVALGIWAGRLGGEALLVLPLALLIGALIGLAMAMDDIGFLVFVRPVTWASVAVLSAAAAIPARLPLEEAGCLAGLFGLYHGYALGGAGEP